MKKKINLIRESKFIKNILLAIMGTAGAQAITMLFSPVITRLYGVESFGLLGTFTAILTVLIPISALSYPIAIVLSKEDNEAENIAKISVIISILISISSALFIIVFSDYIVRSLNIEYLRDYLIIIPIALFFSALKQILEQWLIRNKLFRITAQVAVYQSLFLNIVKTFFGWFSPSGFVLIIITSLGYFTYATLLFIVGGNNSKLIKKISLNKSEFKSVTYKYKDFPLYRAPQQFINALSQSLPTLMLASFFGSKSVGFYALSRMIMGIPSMLGKSVGDVFYPQVTGAINQGKNVSKLLIQATSSLFFIGLIPFSIVILFGPWLFSFVFGADWIIAGEYSQWLSLAMFFSFINRPAVSTLAALRLQKFFLVYEIVSAIVRFTAISLGFYLYKSDIFAVAAFSCSGVVLNIFLIFYTITKSKAKT
ncbi:lipopolysaccharide biosynthesis protein [Vibrio zhugei]|uniref:Lipopolysaccharide biosynthesis protein n=1 Tax=Vibrio zhugei TaxID=2479546 RepID=A0ABV7CDU3_9VIBR|nr:oligosaccharide flippase family protein [Vibrio zhugei]